MEVVNIEKKTFEEMMDRFDSFTGRIESLCSVYRDKHENEWLDGQDVCLILNISPRTLQNYRDSGRISFSQINHKIFYKSNDIVKLLDNSVNKTNNPQFKS